MKNLMVSNNHKEFCNSTSWLEKAASVLPRGWWEQTVLLGLLVKVRAALQQNKGGSNQLLLEMLMPDNCLSGHLQPTYPLVGRSGVWSTVGGVQERKVKHLLCLRQCERSVGKSARLPASEGPTRWRDEVGSQLYRVRLMRYLLEKSRECAEEGGVIHTEAIREGSK